MNEHGRNSLLSGLAGAIALTLVHETGRRLIRGAPRMDVVGKRALAKGILGAGGTPPPPSRLHWIALGGDILLNAIFYAMVGLGRPKQPGAQGAALGSAAGLGAIVLPPLLGLGRKPRGVTGKTKSMTFLWYLIGGLTSAGALSLLGSDRTQRTSK